MLVVCPTPIGNLGDVSRRQRQALEEADVIACEDTRRTGKLLELLGIERVEGRPELWRYDDHTAARTVEPLLERIADGYKVVLVSDAGTPTISDPGYHLVRACRQRQLEVTALPGPVAAVVALSGSGLPTDRFYFEGFLPTTEKRRRQRLKTLSGLDVTVVLYESPRRILSLLDDVEAIYGRDHELCVARELTKAHEEYLLGPLEALREELSQRDERRGEFVVCLASMDRDEEGDLQWAQPDRLIEALHGQGVRPRTIKEVVSEMYDVRRSEIYDRIEKLTDRD